MLPHYFHLTIHIGPITHNRERDEFSGCNDFDNPPPRENFLAPPIYFVA